jgi:pimeloyl-ACP methyl ester carboxylesterase
MAKRPWIDIGIWVFVLCGVYLGRAWLVAWRCGSRYPPADMAIDAGVLALLIVALRLLDQALSHAGRRLLGDQTGRRRVISGAVRGGLVFALAAPLLMSLLQFCPQRQACTRTPAALGLEFEEVWLSGNAGRIAAWYVPQAEPDRPVVLIAHGLGANKQVFLFAARIVHDLGFHAFLFDFRAHGDSQGRFTTFGYNEAEDVKTACDWIAARHPRQPIYALGYSMGGTAVLRAASKYGLFDRLALDATFADAGSAARNSVLRILGPLRTPAWHAGRCWGWIYTGIDLADHRPWQYAAQISPRPLLFIHGTADAMIPHTESQRLHTAAGPSSQLWLIDGFGHIQAANHPDYATRLRDFFAGDNERSTASE